MNEIKVTLRSLKSKAKSTSNPSPNDIEGISGIEKPLAQVYNLALKPGIFPTENWLETAVFFLYKKGKLVTPITMVPSAFKIHSSRYLQLFLQNSFAVMQKRKICYHIFNLETEKI